MRVILIGICIVCFLSLIFMVGAVEKIMTVEADVYAGEPAINDTNVSIVSISVPGYIKIENAISGKVSDETRIYINNTGNVRTLVSAQLIDLEDIIFKNLQMTNGSSTFRNVSSFVISISTSYRSRVVNMRLDLRGTEGLIEDDMIGHQAQVKFIAMQA